MLAFKSLITDPITKPPLFKNDSHPLEASSSFVTLREVKQLRSSVQKGSKGRLDLLRQLLPVRSIELFSGLIKGGNLYQPVLV